VCVDMDVKPYTHFKLLAATTSMLGATVCEENTKIVAGLC